MSYRVKENFFDKIDTQGKAYFLGLMFADGCVQPTSSKKSWSVNIGLQTRDEHILEEFKNILDFEGDLYKYDKRTILNIHNKKLGDGMIRNGCVPRKSLILKYPKTVPDKFTSHFIRGYFDGDGSLTTYKRCAHWSIISTGDFVKSVSKKLKEVGINSTIWFNKKNNYILFVHGNRQIKRLLDWLYKNAKYCLNRKRDKKLEFENLLKEIRPMRIRKPGTIPEQKMIKDYISGEKICNIEKKYDISNRTMYKILKKNSVSLRQKYDITNRTMCKMLKNNNVSLRQKEKE